MNYVKLLRAHEKDIENVANGFLTTIDGKHHRVMGSKIQFNPDATVSILFVLNDKPPKR